MTEKKSLIEGFREMSPCFQSRQKVQLKKTHGLFKEVCAGKVLVQLKKEKKRKKKERTLTEAEILAMKKFPPLFFKV